MTYILGCDTSCDDTSIGIIKTTGDAKYEILSNIRYSQLTKYGGVVPEVAAREHLDQVSNVLKKAIEIANITLEEIDYFSVTVGPGLIGSLLIGSTFIKTLAILYNKPFVAIHHLEGHIASASLIEDCTVVVISGGHSLIASKSPNNIKILCNTLDDAAGEVFDKIGKILALPFPSGKYIENLALKADKVIAPLSIMPGKLNFSFSGLKTKCKQLLETEKPENVAYFLQNTVTKHLIDKLKLISSTETVIVCGGVSENKYIRTEISKHFNCIFPPIELCSDNGVMIAIAAMIRIKNNQKINVYFDEFSYLSIEKWFSTL